MEIALFLEYKQPVNQKMLIDLISIVDPFLKQIGLSPVSAGSYRLYMSSDPSIKAKIAGVIATIKKQPNFRTVVKSCYLTTSFKSV